MKRILFTIPLLLLLYGAVSAQVSRTWIRTSNGVPTSCPARTITINTATGDLYSPNGAGGCTKSSAAAAASGPASSTDNAIARFDGTTGKLLQNSGVIIDDSNNLSAGNVAAGLLSTATAAGTTTLTVASKGIQVFTGTTTQTVVLPVVSTLPQVGFSFVIQNDSSGALTVNSSGGNLVQTMGAGTRATFTCKLLTGTDAASWNVTYISTGSSISGLVTGQYVTAASATTIQTDGVKRYVALLTQTGTDAPVATVHQNSTGITFTWARTGVGVYTLTADSGTPFTVNKTGILIGPAIPGVSGSANIVQAIRTSTSIITVQTTVQDGAAADGFNADARLTETLIEVRIYP